MYPLHKILSYQLNDWPKFALMKLENKNSKISRGLRALPSIACFANILGLPFYGYLKWRTTEPHAFSWCRILGIKVNFSLRHFKVCFELNSCVAVCIVCFEIFSTAFNVLNFIFRCRFLSSEFMIWFKLKTSVSVTFQI